MSKTANSKLKEAARKGDLSGIKKALAEGAEIDWQDDRGWTPTMWAFYEFQLKAAKHLIKQGADLSIRDGLNRDASDLDDNWDMDIEESLDITYSLVDENPGYQERQKEIAAEAHAFAKILKKEMGGKIIPQQFAGIKSNYTLKTRFKDMQCKILVFAGGFEMWIQDFKYKPVDLSLNLKDVDNKTHPRKFEEMIALKDFFSTEFPIYTNKETVYTDNAKEFLAVAENVDDLKQFNLSRYEWLTISAGEINLRHRGTDMAAVRDRFEILGRLFHRNTRIIPPPLLVEQYTIKIDSKTTDLPSKAGEHFWGGITEPPLECGNCKKPAHRIATFQANDPAFQSIKWKSEQIDVVFCLNCSFFAHPALTCVQHGPKPRLVAQGKNDPYEQDPPLETRQITLVHELKKKPGRRSRIGGNPSWIQSDETPDCPVCGEMMRFLGQIISNNYVEFVDDGILYMFLCTKCQVSGSLIQFY